jgi:hypothetical protein
MLRRDDAALLLGQDYESVVAMIADATMRADPLQLAEARAMFALVARRADGILPPTSARHTAALILGPVAAFAETVEDIDQALVTAHGWLKTRPTCVLRELGRAFDELDRTVDMLAARELDIPEAEQADISARWEACFYEASVFVKVGRAPCRIVACGDMLHIRVQDPETGRYLTIAHLPFDPDEDADAIEPTPELVA